MIKINLIAVGDIKENYLKEAIQEYSKRISRFAELKIIEIKENIARTSNEGDIFSALKKDATKILKHLKGYAICLDVKGKMLTSEQFASSIEKLSLQTNEITFVIGASNGIDESVKNACKQRISFSPMTFPHQLMRVIFLEQLYRSFTILNNIAYHK